MTGAAVLAGLGSALPRRVVANAELVGTLDTSDEWIRTRTGITRRHWVLPGEATGDLAVAAGAAALKSAGAGSIDLVVLCTSTPDHRCPATAPDVAARLGLGRVAAFDLTAACSGFLYGLAVCAGYLSAGLAERVLLVGADTFSTVLDPTDRDTAIIFGDGAGACVLVAGQEGQPGAFLAFDVGSDGTLKDLAMIPGGGSRRPNGPGFLTMRGRETFRHAVDRMAASARTVLDRLDWPASTVDRLVAHQANVRILRAVADQVGVPREKAVVDIDRVGNTSAASIPLALAEAARTGRLAEGDRVLLAAFGAGATWGATALVWPRVSPV